MEDFKLELTFKCFCTFPSSRPSIFLLTSFIHSASSCRRPSRWHSGCGAGDHFTASFWNNSKSCNNLALLIVTTTETASVLKWFLANYNSYASWFGLRNKSHATTASAFAAHNLLFAMNIVNIILTYDVLLLTTWLNMFAAVHIFFLVVFNISDPCSFYRHACFGTAYHISGLGLGLFPSSAQVGLR